jgi:hypothetical protein
MIIEAPTDINLVLDEDKVKPTQYKKINGGQTQN